MKRALEETKQSSSSSPALARNEEIMKKCIGHLIDVSNDYKLQPSEELEVIEDLLRFGKRCKVELTKAIFNEGVVCVCVCFLFLYVLFF